MIWLHKFDYIVEYNNYYWCDINIFVFAHFTAKYTTKYKLCVYIKNFKVTIQIDKTKC